MLVWEAVEWEAVVWDEPDEAHTARHGVSVAEIEQALVAGPVFRPDQRGSGDCLAEGTVSGELARSPSSYLSVGVEGACVLGGHVDPSKR
ncbi:MAG: hypothetical protein ACYCUG_02705 [Acidimicrobiales bacterium]